jgi:hypothetical protein
MWLDQRQIGEITSLDHPDGSCPVPTRMISNGEFLPIAQTEQQRRVEHELGQLAAPHSRRLGMSWQNAMVEDVGKAAKDWPGMKFVIDHSGFRNFLSSPDPVLAEFDRTGQIDWVTQLAEVPAKFGMSNVYAELGTTVGSCAVTHPKLAAAGLGTLIRGMGADHVLWGTDSVWYGSPQWQIEAFRRIEIPEAMQKAHGFAPLGAADGKVKTAIFSGNASGVFNLQQTIAEAKWKNDLLAQAKAEYLAAGGKPSNQYYGFIRKSTGKIS